MLCFYGLRDAALTAVDGLLNIPKRKELGMVKIGI